MNLWHPAAKIVRPASLSGGTFIGVPWKVCLHTTEGGGNRNGTASFHGNPYWPHFEVEDGVGITQFLPLDRSAYALYNGPEAGETNRANMIQVEIAGYAADAPNFSAETLRNVASIIRFVHQETGMAIAFPLPFRPPFTDGPRLTGAPLHALEGVIGHQHVGDGNDHTDPGQIDVAALKALLGAPTEENNDMAVRYALPNGQVFVTDGLHRRYVGSPLENDVLNDIGVKLVTPDPVHLAAFHAGLRDLADLDSAVVGIGNAEQAIVDAIAAISAVRPADVDAIVAKVLAGLHVQVDAAGIGAAVAASLAARLAS